MTARYQITMEAVKANVDNHLVPREELAAAIHANIQELGGALDSIDAACRDPRREFVCYRIHFSSFSKGHRALATLGDHCAGRAGMPCPKRAGMPPSALPQLQERRGSNEML